MPPPLQEGTVPVPTPENIFILLSQLPKLTALRERAGGWEVMLLVQAECPLKDVSSKREGAARPSLAWSLLLRPQH